MTPLLCPDCLALKRIAIRNGPTCIHQLNHGVTWFPSWWDTATETRRLQWLEAKQSSNAQPQN